MKKVFISGTDGGLGLSLCKKFIAQNWQVFAGRLSPGSVVEQVAYENSTLCTVVPLDIRSIESVRDAAALVQKQTESLDILINNAGINPSKHAVLEELDFDVVAETINVNAIGPLRVIQQFVSLLEKGESKRIANISSEAGSIGGCFRDAWFGYSMSKAALNIQTRILRNYLGPRGIDLCAIHPGWMRSGMGPAEATYSTDECAEFLFPLIVDRQNTNDNWYYQYDGKPLPY